MYYIFALGDHSGGHSEVRSTDNQEGLTDIIDDLIGDGWALSNIRVVPAELARKVTYNVQSQ